PLVKILDSFTSSDSLSPPQDPLEGCRDRFRAVVAAYLTSRDPAQAQGYVPDRHGHDGQVAGQGLLDHVWRTLLEGGAHEHVASAHVDGYAFISHKPGENQLCR